jgi:hypothetical protein
LVDILIDRTKAVKRDLLQISLTESLEVAAKLTTDQFAALSLIWLITIRRADPSLTAKHCINTSTRIWRPTFRTLENHARHTNTLSLLDVDLLELTPTIPNAFKINYPKLLSSGFTRDHVSNTFGGSITTSVAPLIVPSLVDPCLVQVAPLGAEVVRRIAEAQPGATPEAIETLMGLASTHDAGEDQISESSRGDSSSDENAHGVLVWFTHAAHDAHKRRDRNRARQLQTSDGHEPCRTIDLDRLAFATPRLVAPRTKVEPVAHKALRSDYRRPPRSGCKRRATLLPVMRMTRESTASRSLHASPLRHLPQPTQVVGVPPAWRRAGSGCR